MAPPDATGAEPGPPRGPKEATAHGQHIRVAPWTMSIAQWWLTVAPFEAFGSAPRLTDPSARPAMHEQ